MAFGLWLRHLSVPPLNPEYLDYKIAQEVAEVLLLVDAIDQVSHYNQTFYECLGCNYRAHLTISFDSSTICFSPFTKQGSSLLDYGGRRGKCLAFHLYQTTLLELHSASTGARSVSTDLYRRTRRGWHKTVYHSFATCVRSGMPPCGKRWKLSGSNIIGRERSDSESWRILEFMLIHTKLPPGHLYPQLTQFPTNYPDFLAAFRSGQTVDNNTYLTTGNAVQTHLYKAAIASGHLTAKGNPIQGEFLVDIFLTEEGAEHILTPQDKQYCKMAVELALKSIAENDGEPHPYVGAVVVKDGKVLATGHRGETGEGRHAKFCALKKINDDVDNVDLSGCTVYTTVEPCSIRKPSKTPCTNRLINGKVARVVYGLADKDETVYGHSSLSEAGIEIGLFPKDLIQELLV